MVETAVSTSRPGRRSVLAVLATLAGLVACLQISAPPSSAGVALTPSPGIIVVSYGRTNPTDLEMAWASRGPVSIERKSRGNYTIIAPYVTGTGNSQVSVLGPGAPLPLCNVVSTSDANPGTKIKVRCWNAVTGRTSDAGFSLAFSSVRVPLPSSSYTVLTTKKANKSHTPTNQFRADPGASPAFVTRHKRGTYTVTIPGTKFLPNSGIMTVSATGSSARYCNLAGWSTVDTDSLVRVDCYTRSGARSDALFTLSASTDDVLGMQGTESMAVWYDPAVHSTALEPLDDAYHYAGGGGTDLGRNELQPGRFTVVGGNIVPSPLMQGIAFVSGYGWNFGIPEAASHESTANRCAPGKVIADVLSHQATFEVNCYTPAGYPVSSPFTLSGTIIGAPV